MKRKIISILLVLAVCLSLAVAASAEEILVYDDADLLTAQEERELHTMLSEISRTHNTQILVGTVLTTEGGSIDYMIEAVYDGMDFGYGSARSGVFLLVAMDVREYRILSNGFAGDAIGMHEIDAISQAIVSDLSDGDYASAFEMFAKRCDYYLDGYRNGFPFDFGTNLMIALVIGLAAGLITVLVMKSQLKSVRQQNHANVYVKPGSMRLTAQHDLFLYRNVSRRRRETGSSGPRSGGSRNVGGGRF